MAIKLPHLSVPLIFEGIPVLTGGGSASEQEKKLKQDRVNHSAYLNKTSNTARQYWSKMLSERGDDSPKLPVGIPLLIRVEPGIDLDFMRTAFDFEVVAEHDDGIVIVACEDIELSSFTDKAIGFSTAVRGSGNSAKVYEVFGPENQEVRLNNILSKNLLEKWNSIQDGDSY